MYSNDYRRRAVAFKDEGHTFNELKEAFQIPPETYYFGKRNLKMGTMTKKLPVNASGK
jgi:hypothetical protein